MTDENIGKEEDNVWDELNRLNGDFTKEYVQRSRQNSEPGATSSSPSSRHSTVMQLIGKMNDKIASGGGRYNNGSDEGYRLLDRDETMLLHDDGTDQYNLMAGGQDDWGAVPDLDDFFRSMYSYFYGRGVSTILMRELVTVFIVGFTVAFSTFLFGFVNWGALLQCRDEATCFSFRSYVTARAILSSPSRFLFVLIYFLLFLAYWLWSILASRNAIRDAFQMMSLYRDRFGINEKEIHTIEWSEVVSRFLELQNSGRYRVAIHKRDLTAHDIVSRIMRKENYFIALVNKGVLRLGEGLPCPCSCLLTKSLEWSLNFCILGNMFNTSFTLRRQFIEDTNSLKMRFVIVGMLQLVLVPFLLIFMIMHYFLQHAQDWYASRNYLGPREWTLLATWTFREFNELLHFFERRMEGSYECATAYLRQYPQPVFHGIMRLLRFLSGSFVAVLLVMTLLEDSVLLHVKIWDRNLLWYTGVFSAVYAISRGATPPPVTMGLNKLGQDNAMEIKENLLALAAHNHFMPERWWKRSHCEDEMREIAGLFQYKATVLLYELLGILLGPVVLCFILPSRAQGIIDFILEHSVNVEGIGTVCSYSCFDFDRHGDEMYCAAPSNVSDQSGSPPPTHLSTTDQPLLYNPASASRPLMGGRNGKRDVSRGGKMEKSFISFVQNYPSWIPDQRGKEFVAALDNFEQEQNRAQQVLLNESQRPSFEVGGGSDYQQQSQTQQVGSDTHTKPVLMDPSMLRLGASVTPSMLPSVLPPFMQLDQSGTNSRLGTSRPGSFYWLERFKAAQSSISVPDIPSEQSEEKSISGVYSRDGSTNVFSRTD
eukprot:377886_1